MTGPPRVDGVVVGCQRIPAHTLVEEPGFWLLPFWMHNGTWKLVSWVAPEIAYGDHEQLVAIWAESNAFTGWVLYNPEQILLVAPA